MQPVKNPNYGRRIEGPWVFGLYTGKMLIYNIADFSYLNEDHKNILILIIQRKVFS